MRPLRLSMSAFGPYASRQELDFGSLGPAALFLLAGPTGSGKTTILDATCFALYGETSGGEREGEEMRSHHADPAVVTEVVLDFALGDERYRVARRPEQLRARKRGDGLARERASATLWALDASGAEREVLASGASKVRREVEQRLGFDADQFRQVIVLPQGQFRRLLTADSRTRETIFQRLFQTEVHRRLERRLGEAAAALRGRHAGLDQQRIALRRSLAGLLEVGESAEAAAELREAAGRLDEDVARSAEAARQAQETEASERAARDRGLEARRLLDALQAARNDAHGLESERGRHEQRQAELDRARRARTVDDVVRVAEARRREATDAATRADRLEGKLEKAEALRAEAEAARTAAASDEREREREAARSERVRLADLAGAVAALASARQDETEALERLDERSARFAELKQARDEAQRRSGALEEELAAATRRAEQLDGLQESLDRAARDARQRDDLERSRRELAEAAKTAAARERRAADADKALADARAALRHAEDASSRGRAALLAAELVDGEPCPVCGAREHPRPAAIRGDVPNDEELQASRIAVEKAAEGRDVARDAAFEAVRRREALEARLQALAAGLGVGADADPAALHARVSGLEDAVRAARAAADRIAALTRERDEVAATWPAQEDAAALETAIAEAKADVEARRAIVAERLRAVPEELRDPAALEGASRRAETRVRFLEHALEDVRGRAREAAESCASARTAATTAREEATKAAARGGEAERELARRLAEAGFVDREDHAAARRDGDTLAELEEAVRSHDERRAATAAALRQAAAAAESVEEPDLEALASRLEQAESAAADATRLLGRLQERQGAVKKALHALRELDEGLAAVDDEHALVGRLAEVASGRNAQNLSFQRYVLATLLDEVLEVASRRLQRMSRGRYRLRRSLEAGDRRTAAGLDLEVDDAHTGRARPVATLSGGEGFLAALALALALADVVQARSGGVFMEAVFVDEGFGSLDPDALDLALAALLELRAGGRLVGVISHVPELAERIDVRLEVTPSREGSTARFVLP